MVADEYDGHAHGLAWQPSVAQSMIAAHRLPENAFRQGRQSQAAYGRSLVRASYLCTRLMAHPLTCAQHRLRMTPFT